MTKADRIRRRTSGAEGQPQRRSQEQRIAETRAKIIDATIEYIDEKGFHQASLARVAQRAGVTVGAVQHHFANKSELLTAAVNDCFAHLADGLSDLGPAGGSVQSRVGRFIETAWEFCNSARFQSGLQILLGMRDETWGNYDAWQDATLGKVMQNGFAFWKRVFADIDMTKKERDDLLLFVFSALSGTALMYRISQNPLQVKSDLSELKRLLLLRFEACQSRTSL